jgi:hypothetical protein
VEIKPTAPETDGASIVKPLLTLPAVLQSDVIATAKMLPTSDRASLHCTTESDAQDDASQEVAPIRKEREILLRFENHPVIIGFLKFSCLGLSGLFESPIHPLMIVRSYDKALDRLPRPKEMEIAHGFDVPRANTRLHLKDVSDLHSVPSQTVCPELCFDVKSKITNPDPCAHVHKAPVPGVLPSFKTLIKHVSIENTPDVLDD